MRADPDRNEDLDEVNSSRYYEERPRIRQSSPPAASTPPPSRQSPVPMQKTPPPPRSSSPSSQTPLLTATLNAPPQAYYAGINGNVRVKCPTDLSVTLTKKSKGEDSNFTDSQSQGLSNQSHPQAVFYSTLLKQLRQKAGDGAANQQVQVVPIKVKKEKGGQKPLPFMCPACKKRFQRHIAMNAHFQNEHISPASQTGERSCKLCGGVSPSLSAVRLHLLTSHNIDLDNPAKCLVEDPTSFPSKYSVLEASLRSGTNQEESEPSCSNIDMSESSRSCSPHMASPSPAHTPTSSESPERSLFPIKQDFSRQVGDDEDIQVEDLSLRRPSPSSPVLGKSVNQYNTVPKSPRPESPCAKPIKRPRLRESSPSPTFSFQQSQLPSPPASKFVCSHCNIVYPNQTLYFLHKGFHSESNPWRCNGCGHQSADLYDFNTHLFSVAHQ